MYVCMYVHVSNANFKVGLESFGIIFCGNVLYGVEEGLSRANCCGGGGGGVIQINFPKSPCSSNFYNMLEMLT